jgi:hypothetical protein
MTKAAALRMGIAVPTENRRHSLDPSAFQKQYEGMCQATREISLFKWLLRRLLLSLPVPPVPVSFGKASQSTHREGKAWISRERTPSKACLDISEEKLWRLRRRSRQLWLRGPIAALCFVNRSSTLLHLLRICVSRSSFRAFVRPLTHTTIQSNHPRANREVSPRGAPLHLWGANPGLHLLLLPVHRFRALRLCKECAPPAHRRLRPGATDLRSSVQRKWFWRPEHRPNQRVLKALRRYLSLDSLILPYLPMSIHVQLIT